MVAPLEPLKAVECSYMDCLNSFESEEQMIAHKKQDHEYYCNKCKHDGIDWDDDLRHKVNDMAQVIYEGRRDVRYDSVVKKTLIKRKFNHIVCEFCGTEFGSLTGRDLHKKQVHQADHQIVCPGYQMVYDPELHRNVREECKANFGRASQFISHIELGYCRYITVQELERERQHKQIVKEIMMDPEKFRTKVQGSKALESSETASIAAPLSIMDTDNDPNGGIGLGLMSQGNTSDKCLHAGSELAKTSLGSNDHNLPISRERSPALSSGYQEALSNAMVGISVGSRSSSIGRSTPTPTNQRSAITSPSASRYSEDYPGLGSSTSTATGSSTSLVTPNRWAKGGNMSKDLFPSARPTPSETSAKALAESHKRTQREDARTNLFRSHFWDPTHPDYNVEIFRNHEPGRNKYTCPFSECESHIGFDIPADISHHLRSQHSETNKQCRTCNKKFKTLAGLVSHYEASERGGKCRVSKSDGYRKFIDEATGGFLSADRVDNDKIWGMRGGSLGGGLGVDGDEDNPIGYRNHKYEAQLPNADIRW